MSPSGCLVVIFVIAINSGSLAIAEPVNHLPTQQRYAAYAEHTAECFSCVDCKNATNSTKSKICPSHLEAAKAKKCVVYSEKFNYINDTSLNTWYIRGCASERGSCSDIEKVYAGQKDKLITLEFCRECEGDRCNGVGRSLPELTFAIVTLVITPMLAKFTVT